MGSFQTVYTDLPYTARSRFPATKDQIDLRPKQGTI